MMTVVVMLVTTASTLLREANELAESKNCTRDFALYNMFRRAMAEGDEVRAESCMKLLEQEFRNSFSNIRR